MPDEQPRIDVLSHNRINHSTVVIALVPTIAITVVLVMAIWAYLTEIGYLLLGLMALVSIYLVARGYIDLRKRWFHSAIIFGDEYGVIALDRWEHLPTRALPAPIITEETHELSPEDKEVVERSKVLTMHLEQGIGMHAIADETGIPYQKVRAWCNTAKRLRAKSDQEEA